jgi:hypothetical protein
VALLRSSRQQACGRLGPRGLARDINRLASRARSVGRRAGQRHLATEDRDLVTEQNDLNGWIGVVTRRSRTNWSVRTKAR